MAPLLILASQSPRRKQLLSDAGYEFRVIPPDESIEQGVCADCSPAEFVLRASLEKARAVAAGIPDGLVLAADTVAVCQGQMLGKPRDEQHAEQMLRLMSGQRHQVLTGVTLWHRPSDRRLSRLSQTVLRMDPLSDQDLRKFLDSDQWIGKAGAFGYQDGLDWIQVEQGLESNVVGLPIEELEGWINELQIQANS